VPGFCEHGNEHSASIKDKGILVRLEVFTAVTIMIMFFWA
jgi:hypothetical protein